MNHKAIFPWIVAAMIGAQIPSALAQDARADLVRQISVAQGVQEMFDQQLEQQRQSLQGYGSKLVNDMAAQSGRAPGAEDGAIFQKFMERAGRIFSAEELTNQWVANYGTQLSNADLEAILAYYTSATGKKEVEASKATMSVFTLWMHQEAQTRFKKLLSELATELAQIEPADPPAK